MAGNDTKSVKQSKFTPHTAWKKGVSGNPKGRPKTGQALTDIMREVLEEELPSGKLRKEALVRKVLELAYEGNESMIRMAWGYLEGMPTQRQELTGRDGKDLPVPIFGGLSTQDDIQEDNSNNKDIPTEEKD